MKQTDLIKILVTSRNVKTKDGKKKFKSFKTKMELVVKGEEEKGKQIRWITTYFAGEQDTKSITRGLLTVKVSDIKYPKIYEITKDENGNDVYPSVTIFNYSAFEEKLKDVDNPFVTDEQETSETEIDDSNDEELESEK